MTTAGEALVDQGVVVGGEAVVGGIGADTGVVVVPGPGGRRLAQLVDVELVDSPEPTTLVRDPDTGIFHSRPLSQIRTETRGSTVWYVDRPPPHVLPDEWRPGDWITVIAGDERGTVYLITEE